VVLTLLLFGSYYGISSDLIYKQGKYSGQTVYNLDSLKTRFSFQSVTNLYYFQAYS